MKRKLTFLMVLLVLVQACKKQEIETIPANNDPVFYLSGTWDSQPIQYYAGVDNMEMKYGVEERNGVDYSFGELTDGLTSIKLGIFDGNLELPSLASAIKIGDTLFMASVFNDNLANLWKGNFTNDVNISSIDWYVNGVYAGVNQLFISEPGVYNVCGNFNFANGSHKNICNTLYLGFKENMDFSIRHFLSESGDLKLWLEGDVADFESVEWKIEDSVVANFTTYSGTIDQEQKVIAAKVKHKNGAVRVKTIVIDGTFSGNYIEDFNVCKLPLNESEWDYSVGLEAIINGEKFTSFEVPNYKSKVVILEIQNYETNPQGQVVLKVKAQIDAKLKSKANGEIIHTNFISYFAIPL